MTPSSLKSEHLARNPESLFFSRTNMAFSGDSMGNYGVILRPDLGAYELYRKHPVKNGLKASAFFDATTFKRVFPAVH